jgi:BirA family transcriptional regulator, biotin operon repressor / biotin---[acetyl-CoA-carboxylase] ligase
MTVLRAPTDPIAPLSESAITSHLRNANVRLPALQICAQIDSTNRYCLEQSDTLASGTVCLAEAQTNGRGRAGRHWVATPHKNIMLSLAWIFAKNRAGLPGLSLMAGLATLRALDAYGVRDTGVKWPNDILWNGRKLAGLLIDTRAHHSEQTLAVLGVGINVSISPNDGLQIDQPWVDLAHIADVIDRDRLTALVIEQLVRASQRYAAQGFDDETRTEWEQRHVYQGQPVQLQAASGDETGVVVGVDRDGALRVRDSIGAERRYYSGDIRLRGQAVTT